jgi:hypothetical protein
MASILDRLADLPFDLHAVSLVCSEEALRARMARDGRGADAIGQSVARLPLYGAMRTLKVDTTALPVPDVADRILETLRTGEARSAR